MSKPEDNKRKEQALHETTPRVGLTHGDFNGIGYEVILRCLADSRMLRLMTPVLYGSEAIYNYYRKRFTLDLPERLHRIHHADEAREGEINIIETDASGIDLHVTPGEPTRAAGLLAARALRDAAEDLVAGRLDGVVTAPIHKDMTTGAEFPFTGHTEFFASYFPDSHPLMLFTEPSGLHVALATIHEPLSAVPSLITREHLVASIVTLEQSLIRDFGIVKPRLVVMGLNPHAGENGLIGREEPEVIAPAIEEAWQRGIQVFGPAAPDGLWGSGSYRTFDGILAMYHDQGLIPFKLLAMDTGVNVTTGLPIVRTSPDHGTAYDIAGRGIADPHSFRSAIYTAIDIIASRRSYNRITADPLPTSIISDERRP